MSCACQLTPATVASVHFSALRPLWPLLRYCGPLFGGRVPGCQIVNSLEVLLGLTAYGLITTIFFPEPWWARFVPLAWVIPIGAVCLADTLRPTMFVRSCTIICIALSALNVAIAGNSAVRDGLGNAADIKQKLERMVHDPSPVYLSRGPIVNARLGDRHAAEDVWRRRMWDRGKTAVVIVRRADCRKIELLRPDVERCASPDSPP